MVWSVCSKPSDITAEGRAVKTPPPTTKRQYVVHNTLYKIPMYMRESTPDNRQTTLNVSHTVEVHGNIPLYNV